MLIPFHVADVIVIKATQQCEISHRCDTVIKQQQRSTGIRLMQEVTSIDYVDLHSHWLPHYTPLYTTRVILSDCW